MPVGVELPLVKTKTSPTERSTLVLGYSNVISNEEIDRLVNGLVSQFWGQGQHCPVESDWGSSKGLCSRMKKFEFMKAGEHLYEIFLEWRFYCPPKDDMKTLVEL